ncbi:putative RNA methylase [Paenibacillus sp. JGP012]|uniref:Eco57I restriction-modification methylase domain-containing protein n=1 Tax=Paenibacillus sp. JGP012 TaxID=2735914 RepID=UPI001607C520|nr:N-6 DNA methylase [Paenibacillus sp. JGP012]MBB6019524.1 putative RNA methylase [Paenibacillus sp. JGP012]
MNKRCQVFTPSVYVEKLLDTIEYFGENILKKTILENSCGDGNILAGVVKRYIEAALHQNYSLNEITLDLEKYITGFEIDPQVLDVCLNNLNSITAKYGIEKVNWNIHNIDYLKASMEKFDYIVGNPPYIMYQRLEEDERAYLKQNFTSCNKGKFDYCYAFIEKSIHSLSLNGKMSYIIPNSIFKNVYAKELRNIMLSSLEVIYDYKESTVFDNVLTSPAIIFINKNQKSPALNYFDIDNQIFKVIDKSSLGDKWLFNSNESIENKIRQHKFGDFFKVSNSVATLLNSAFVINQDDILTQGKNYIELDGYIIEKGILRPAASSRGYALNREEYIIFPYSYSNEGKLIRYDEEEFSYKYPGAYAYLLKNEKKLKERKIDKSAKWYEYGRSQALAYLNQDKLIMSSVITNKIKAYRANKDTIPYSGFYITSISNKSLFEAEEILRSEDFYSYIFLRGINANGKSFRISVHDILNYSIDSPANT